MEWYYAVKIAMKSLLDERKRNILIGLICVTIISSFMIVTIPVSILSLPQSAFSSSKEEADKITDEYRQYLTEYKSIIHDNIKSERAKLRSSGKTVKELEINYPSLSVLIAYENVVNKDRYNSNSDSRKIDKNEIMKFLNTCMSYELEGEKLIAKVKSPSAISQFFSNSDDQNMFKTIYEGLMSTDLDNTVPDVEFKDFDYNEASAEIPYYNQGDPRWGDYPYSTSNIRVSGCGVTSMAMILSGLFPSNPILPPEMADWASKRGYYIPGVGTAWSFFDGVAKEYDLNMKIMSRNNPQEILDTLSSGIPIIVSMSPGHFTRGGHFIVLKGIEADGKIKVYDCGSVERTQRTWDFSIILSESAIASPNCFWAFTKK